MPQDIIDKLASLRRDDYPMAGEAIQEINRLRDRVKGLLESNNRLVEERRAAEAKAWRLDELMRSSTAVHLSLLNGTLPIDRGQLLHAAGLDANIADQAALWQKVERLADWDMLERKWTAQWYGESEYAGAAEALRRTGAAT